MNKRCIVNVATGDFYCYLQHRLLLSFKSVVDDVHLNLPDVPTITTVSGDDRGGIDMMLWYNCLPAGSAPHSESPYGFKVHAIKAAYDKGYTSILWVDSPAYAVKEDISPIFTRMENEGYYAMGHDDALDNWVGEFALSRFNLSRNQIMHLLLPSGSCYGFDMEKQGFYLLMEMLECERAGLFRSEVMSPTSCHRHDEAILALTLFKHNLPVFVYDHLFQSDSPECVIRSGGEMKL